MQENVVVRALPSGGSESISFAMRPQTAGADSIYVALLHPAMDLSLRLPSGTVVRPESAAEVGLHWTKTSGTWVLGLCDKAQDWIIIELPPGSASGRYFIEATLPATAPATRLCATSLTLGALQAGAIKNEVHEIGTWVATDRKSYQLGDVVKISVPVLEGGKPIPNARVEASLHFLEGRTERGEAGRVTLRLESSGNYEGTFQPSSTGSYVVHVTIPGRTREQIAEFSVELATANLVSATLSKSTGSYQMSLRFHVLADGHYTITPYLRSGNGNVWTLPFDSDLITGDQEIVRPMDERWIDEANRVLPYDLFQVLVVRANPSARFRVDYAGTWRKQADRWLLAEPEER